VIFDQLSESQGLLRSEQKWGDVKEEWINIGREVNSEFLFGEGMLVVGGCVSSLY
jgi:hypothetical protein